MCQRSNATTDGQTVNSCATFTVSYCCCKYSHLPLYRRQSKFRVWIYRWSNRKSDFLFSISPKEIQSAGTGLQMSWAKLYFSQMNTKDRQQINKPTIQCNNQQDIMSKKTLIKCTIFVFRSSFFFLFLHGNPDSRM